MEPQERGKHQKPSPIARTRESIWLGAVLLLMLTLSACIPTPPTPAPAREATQLAAGFSTTWEAVIDHFAENNIPISTIERASGIIATERLSVSLQDSREFADCGTTEWGDRIFAGTVTYNVLVRGDENRSTVLITATWYPRTPAPWGCETKGVWEDMTQEAIARRIQRR